MIRTTFIIFLSFIISACDSEFASTSSFGDGGSKKKEAPPQSENAEPFIVGTPAERTNGSPPDFANGEDYLQNVDALFGGDGNRDCNKEALLDPEESITVSGHGEINNIVNTNCLTGMPGGSAIFNRDKEKSLLCNLLGFQTVVSSSARGWSSPGDNFTAQFEESGVDEKTGLPTGQLVNKPARSVPNTWISGLTCQGKLHDQCQYFRNEQGKIDCTGL